VQEQQNEKKKQQGKNKTNYSKQNTGQSFLARTLAL
jgi:hypothetical protein